MKEDSEGKEESVREEAGITGLDAVGVGIIAEERRRYRPFGAQGLEPTGAGKAQEPIECAASEGAKESSCEDITRIVEAEINSGIAAEAGP